METYGKAPKDQWHITAYPPMAWQNKGCRARHGSRGIGCCQMPVAAFLLVKSTLSDDTPSIPSWWNPCEHSPWRLPECIQGASASSRVREWNTQRSPVKGASFLCLVGFWRTMENPTCKIYMWTWWGGSPRSQSDSWITSKRLTTLIAFYDKELSLTTLWFINIASANQQW